MTIIWWTLYIIGALTAIITWLNLMMLLGRLFKIIYEKEWAQIKVVEGPPGPKGDRCERGPEGPRGLVGASGSFIFGSDAKRTVKEFMAEEGLLNRKDIEALIRMEVAVYMNKFAISHTTFPGLGSDETKIVPKNLGDWQTNQSKVDADKLIQEYHESKEDK